jgi:hypothetical protein
MVFHRGSVISAGEALFAGSSAMWWYLFQGLIIFAVVATARLRPFEASPSV